MLYGEYRFKCRLESEAQLPVYKGSTFRGVFGRALKQVVCALKRQECPTCLLRWECLYPAVFEPTLTISQVKNNGQSPVPHPYVLQPPPEKQVAYEKGAPFNFNLLLFGKTNERLAYFIYALDRMGQIGIGKKIKGRRASFLLESVESSGREIYSHGDQKLSGNHTFQDIRLEPNEQTNRKANSITIAFNTPLRLKHKNSLSNKLPFHILVRAMLRRSSSLMQAYDNGEPMLDYPGMVHRAQGIRTIDSTLTWEDWRRYSLRQDQDMMMGGIRGSVTYGGNLDEFLPLIDFCSHVHLGKQTTFGLGRFHVESIR
jgi:hypothetical protein